MVKMVYFILRTSHHKTKYINNSITNTAIPEPIPGTKIMILFALDVRGIVNLLAFQTEKD